MSKPPRAGASSAYKALARSANPQRPAHARITAGSAAILEKSGRNAKGP
jgi:hypothetical protein